MKVLYSNGFGVLVLAAPDEFARMLGAVDEFLCSPAIFANYAAEWPCDLRNSERCLESITVVKTGGPIVAAVDGEVLLIRGSPDNLRVYLGFLKFHDADSGDHRHPEFVQQEGYLAADTVSVIFEIE
jgi:hypothetical protein